MKTAKPLTVGTAIPNILETLGVQTVFGIPGNHTAELYRGLALTRIRHITCRHEQGASFMADGYARGNGGVGVCFLISGPGFLNAATGIVQAQQDCVPLLIITTHSGTPNVTSALHQMPDQLAAARGMCKKLFTITDASQVERTVNAAYTLCQAASPGVVVVSIPAGLLDETLPGQRPIQKTVRPPAWQPGKAFLDTLLAARRPLLLLGGGTRHVAAMQLLAQRLDMPVLNTVNGKGVIPHSHPLSVGGSPSLPCIKRALANADLVLALGTQFSETDFDLLMNATPGNKAKMFYIDTAEQTPPVVPRSNHIRVALQDAVSTLLDVVPQQRRRGALRAARLRKQIQREPHYHPQFARVFAAIHAAADDLILVGDSTRPTYYASWMYECEQAGHYFHSASGFGTLGYAIPAAFGAQIATQAPVVALIGDGGAQFTLTELATAVDQQLGVPIIIWCNQGYEEITNSLQARGVDATTTDISSPNFEHIARAYGIRCYLPRTTEGLTRAIRQALKQNRPGLILIKQDVFIQEPSGAWYG